MKRAWVALLVIAGGAAVASTTLIQLSQINGAASFHGAVRAGQMLQACNDGGQMPCVAGMSGVAGQIPVQVDDGGRIAMRGSPASFPDGGVIAINGHAGQVAVFVTDGGPHPYIQGLTGVALAGKVITSLDDAGTAGWAIPSASGCITSSVADSTYLRQDGTKSMTGGIVFADVTSPSISSVGTHGDIMITPEANFDFGFVDPASSASTYKCRISSDVMTCIAIHSAVQYLTTYMDTGPVRWRTGAGGLTEAFTIDQYGQMCIGCGGNTARSGLDIRANFTQGDGTIYRVTSVSSSTSNIATVAGGSYGPVTEDSAAHVFRTGSGGSVATAATIGTDQSLTVVGAVVAPSYRSTVVASLPTCASGIVGTTQLYSKSAGAEQALCICERHSSAYAWIAASASGDCT